MSSADKFSAGREHQAANDSAADHVDGCFRGVSQPSTRDALANVLYCV